MRHRNDEDKFDGIFLRITSGKSRQHNYKFDDMYTQSSEDKKKMYV